MMFMGLTVAIVTGVPLGTFIGQNFGWRATFWAVAASALVAFAGIACAAAGNALTSAARQPAGQVRVLGSGRLLIVFAMTALGYGGTFVAFTFLAPILEQITGFSATSVSLILVLYGLAIAAGNLVGGRIANHNPVQGTDRPVCSCRPRAGGLHLHCSLARSGTDTLAALGFLSFANVPGLQLYVVQLARKHRPGAVDVASALNIAAFNLGIAIGAWIGGLVVESRWALVQRRGSAPSWWPQRWS